MYVREYAPGSKLQVAREETDMKTDKSFVQYVSIF